MKNINEEEMYERAKARVYELKKFYNNLFSYIVVVSFLAGLNYYTNEWRNPWFLWCAAGWGLGIVFHAIKAYQINPVFNKDWEENKIRKYMEEEQQNGQHWE